MPVERRGQAIRVMVNLANWQQEEPTGCGGGRQLSMDGTSRVTGDCHARFCERLGVKFPGPTRRRLAMIVPTATAKRIPLRTSSVFRLTAGGGHVREVANSRGKSPSQEGEQRRRIRKLLANYRRKGMDGSGF